ncbi:ribosomal protein L6 [Thermodesulfatator indicus DSM 15286]|uniref:Large ribosomal subunit protein uL6 n=1 Tax=Thermodesulfatator indicus (strain DSM 15286 / JCM 11887 / CIR29812) TaxID=667014 RepID=F8AA52_THEID|nr:50S ribosomal protein L6 [Thermodesulfatator indicus]AEH45340.1 ribosomal protein L6 [Thermodesulfatator indicus DSM 15286]
MLSRIGRKPIPLPDGVKVEIKEDKIIVQGPKGRLEKPRPPLVEIKVEDKEVKVLPAEVQKRLATKVKAFHGLARALLNNWVVGVYKGFTKSLDIVGLGYKADLKGDTLILSVGYSHPVEFKLPKGVSAKVQRGAGDVQFQIILEGIDKELVGQTAANIRKIRPPEPYKGKGIRYTGEKILRKAGKGGKK